MLRGVKSRKRVARPGFGMLPSETLAGKKRVRKKPPLDENDEVKQVRKLGRTLRAVGKVLQETKKGGMRQRQYLALEKLFELIRVWQKN